MEQFSPLQLYRYDMRKADFIICRSCFWCTSCLVAGHVFSTCLQCKNEIVDSLPISDDEFYNVEIWDNGNIELIFEKA